MQKRDPMAPATLAGSRIVMPAPEGSAPAILEGLRPPTTADLAPAEGDDLQQVARQAFEVWALFSGIKADERDFDFDHHRYLRELYKACGDMTPESEMAFRKPAQVGATLMEELFLLWIGRFFQVKVALFFPGKMELDQLVADRFNPLIESNPALSAIMHPVVNTMGLKRMKNVLGGWSSLYLRNIHGQAATEQFPADALLYDEMRKYKRGVLEPSFKRIQHSDFKIRRYMSVPDYEGQNIDELYLDGTREVWLSKCRCSDGGVNLAETFPNCIGFRGNEAAFYRCPQCKTIIVDPQNGAWVAQNPRAHYRSFTCSSMVSPKVTPSSIWHNYTHTQDIEEFHHADLGHPYVDAKNKPITEQVLTACTPALCGGEPVHWAYCRPDLKALRTRNAIGVDQGGNYLYVVILRRARDGLLDLVHLEIVEADNPVYWRSDAPEYSQFPRLHQLYKEFGIECGVLDGAPNYAPALEAAQAFRGRLFLADYNSKKEMIIWKDQEEKDPKKTERSQVPWEVSLEPYKMMDFAFKLLIDRRIRLPHPDQLVQVYRHASRGRFLPQRIARNFWKVLTKMIRHKEQKGDGTEYRMEWRGPKADHWAHSFSYAVSSAERVQPSARVYL
jgi:hypothetical protein